MGIRRTHRFPGTRRCGRVRRWHLALAAVIAVCLTSAALTPSIAAATAKFQPNHKTFTDDFSAFDQRYWTVQTLGGVEVDANDATGLTCSIPAEVTEPYFYGLVIPKEDFFIKANSDFHARLLYQCLNWPHANGVHVVLVVTVLDKTNKKTAYQLSVARDSNNSSRDEEYSLSIWKGAGRKAKHVWKTQVTDDRNGSLHVVHLKGVLRAAAGGLIYEFKPKETKLGRVLWSLKVDGQQAYFGFQPVSVGLTKFWVWSAKGFHEPSPEW